jgi:hypothetical protein
VSARRTSATPRPGDHSKSRFITAAPSAPTLIKRRPGTVSARPLAARVRAPMTKPNWTAIVRSEDCPPVSPHSCRSWGITKDAENHTLIARNVLVAIRPRARAARRPSCDGMLSGAATTRQPTRACCLCRFAARTLPSAAIARSTDSSTGTP